MSESMEEPIIFIMDKHKQLLPAIVDIHIACIEKDSLIATFLPPFDRKKMMDYWESYGSLPTHTIIMQMEKGQVLGYVVLKDSGTETGPFRGEVLKLLVSPEHRRRGIAKRMMLKLEALAEDKGLTALVLDTITESQANAVYPRLGWIELGTLPKNAISPDDGRLMDNTFYYKLLPSHEVRWGPQ